MKMKSEYLLMIGFSILCSSHVLRGQSSNSTTGGFMNQINSWISRLRGNNNSNNNQNNNNNNNNSDKDKETQNKGQQQQQQQMSPVQYGNTNGMVMPYPMMTGMPSMYGPMSPMTMSFAPRPMPSAAFGPGIPFGSLAAGSSMGQMGQIALGSSLGSSMASSLGSPMASAISSGLSSSYPQMNQLSGMRPSYSSASHMMPVHHDYPDSGNDYQVGSYGSMQSMPNSFSNSGFSPNNYGSLGGSGPEQQISDSAYNGEPVEENNPQEYSSAYHR